MPTDKQGMGISIITPSLNMLSYIKKCVYSVRDQGPCVLEHIIRDGGSTDGTVEWLAAQERLTYVSEPDSGMYDAVNKGIVDAKGKILAYLNCDEQYLPGTLEWVKSYFGLHPDVDILFGDALLIRPDGSLAAFWKGYRPRRIYIFSSYLYVLTCTMFFRRRIVDEGHLFDQDFKIIGDAEFVGRMLRAGYSARHVRRYFSVYTMTGNNLSLDNSVRGEYRILRKRIPGILRGFSWIFNLARLTEKFISGAYFQSMPLKYAVYTDAKKERQCFIVDKASFRWKNEESTGT